MTGNEFGEYKDIKDLRKIAKQYYKENLQGTSVENPILGEVNLTNHSIDFTKTGIDKAISTSAKEHKLLLIKHLPELIKNATQARARENKKTKRAASQYTYLYTTAKIDGKEQPVEITIFTDVNGNRYYNHILPLEEKNKRNLPVYSAQASASEDGIPTVRRQVPSIISSISQTKNISKENFDIIIDNPS